MLIPSSSYLNLLVTYCRKSYKFQCSTGYFFRCDFVIICLIKSSVQALPIDYKHMSSLENGSFRGPLDGIDS